MLRRNGSEDTIVEIGMRYWYWSGWLYVFVELSLNLYWKSEAFKDDIVAVESEGLFHLTAYIGTLLEYRHIAMLY